MDYSPDPATTQDAPDAVTFGDLCFAIEKGRVSVDRHNAHYKMRVHDVRRWLRQEESLRIMLAPLTDALALDLGGL
ncbi:MAG: hypothetical protein KGO05_08215 [Chloroflexota bacterium]|nr:hypothetical protein [Chloroflexota bacterium]